MLLVLIIQVLKLSKKVIDKAVNNKKNLFYTPIALFLRKYKYINMAISIIWSELQSAHRGKKLYFKFCYI
ncbi:hypothetical protein NIES2130_07830 [Scytonema sp. HK-05]|nr:hypothetical protein NIES2130_07830 [Scytonema sp. HK-05]